MYVGLDEDLGQLLEALVIIVAQVFVLILCEGAEEEEGHVEVVKEIDDSGSATLASPVEGPTDFANASGAGDDGSRAGVIGQEIDQSSSFCVVQKLPRCTEEFGSFDNRDGE